MASVFKTARSVLGALFLIFVLISFGAFLGRLAEHQNRLVKPAILVMDLEGIIIDGKQFLEDLREYRDNPNIKGILIRMNSPGGVVGPSQEIYSELKRVRDEFKKPVVVACGALAASGAYYAAVAADKIITNPGCLMGSIGVIMEFANLEKLYDWAKIQRYALKTGPFKDSGADYRMMTESEKALFQEMINNVHAQFKGAVQEGRKLEKQVVDTYADGRVFTGEKAVELGFADALGTYEDALKAVGELAGLGAKPEVFEPPKKRPSLFEVLSDMNEEASYKNLADRILPQQLFGKPLYLLPGTTLSR